MTHKIFIANRRCQPKSLHEEFGDIPVFDVTFAGGDPLLSTLSPMYPHGDLPIPANLSKPLPKSALKGHM